MRSAVLIVLPILVAGCTFVRPKEVEQRDRAVADAHTTLTGVLVEQVGRWNDGDIAGFMSHYWNDERMTFSSGGTTHRGWQAAYERYQRRYPTRDEMGTLTFSDIAVHRLGDQSAYVTGRWQVAAATADLDGLFTLVFRLIDGRWLIVHDHTSMACPS